MQNRLYYEKFLPDGDFKYYLDLVLNEKVMVMNYGRVFTMEEANLTYKGMLKNNKKHEDFGLFKVFEKSTNTFIGYSGIIINKDFV